jgi:hypothetical protein
VRASVNSNAGAGPGSFRAPAAVPLEIKLRGCPAGLLLSALSRLTHIPENLNFLKLQVEEGIDTGQPPGPGPLRLLGRFWRFCGG